MTLRGPSNIIWITGWRVLHAVLSGPVVNPSALTDLRRCGRCDGDRPKTVQNGCDRGSEVSGLRIRSTYGKHYKRNVEPEKLHFRSAHISSWAAKVKQEYD